MRYPKEAHTRRQRANIHAYNLNFEKALQDLAMAYSLNSKDPDTMINFARTYAMKKDAKSASGWLAAAKPLAKTKPQLLDYWATVDKVATLTKDSKLNVEAMTERAKLQDYSPWALHNLSIALGNDGQIDKAIEHSRKALEKMEFGAAKNRLSWLLSFKARQELHKSPEKASRDRNIEEMLKEANRYDPDNVHVYISLAHLYLERVKSEKESDWVDNADDYITEGHKRHPTDQKLLEFLAYSAKMKTSLAEYFKSKGIKPSGRWPATFKGK